MIGIIDSQVFGYGVNEIERGRYNCKEIRNECDVKDQAFDSIIWLKSPSAAIKLALNRPYPRQSYAKIGPHPRNTPSLLSMYLFNLPEDQGWGGVWQTIGFSVAEDSNRNVWTLRRVMATDNSQQIGEEKTTLEVIITAYASTLEVHRLP